MSAGPPLFRIQQLVALLEAGVVTIVGPQATFKPYENAPGYHVQSPHVAGFHAHADWLVDSRIRTPLLGNDGSALFRQMSRDGYIQPYRYPAADSDLEGLDTDRHTLAVLGADAKPTPGVWAIGIPTEGGRWFTQVGSATPGVQSRFTKDAITVAREAIRHAGASTPQPIKYPSQLEQSL